MSIATITGTSSLPDGDMKSMKPGEVRSLFKVTHLVNGGIRVSPRQSVFGAHSFGHSALVYFRCSWWEGGFCSLSHISVPYEDQLI